MTTKTEQEESGTHFNAKLLLYRASFKRVCTFGAAKIKSEGGTTVQC